MMAPDKAFHLYLLIGQSNMAGRGEVGAEDTEIHPRVYALDRSNQWAPASDPIHFDKPIAAVGPGLTFGKVMADLEPRPAVRVGLIPCAAGGSPITAWRPGVYWEQTDSQPYGDALTRTRIAQQSGVLKGILWHQGESDSNENDATRYLDRLEALIARLRSELGAPDVPFVAATLGDFVVSRNVWAQVVNDALCKLPQRVDRTACVEATGLDHNGDNLHFDAASAHELGRRYAKAMVQLQHGGGNK
jgi:hypothetical protein